MSEQNFQSRQDVHEDPAYEDPLAELARIVAGEEPVAPEQSQQSQPVAELTPGTEQETAQDISQDMGQQFLSDDSQIGDRLAGENMDLESQLMAELSGEAVPIVTDRPEEIPHPQAPKSELASELVSEPEGEPDGKNDTADFGQPVGHETFSQQLDDLAGSQGNMGTDKSPPALNTSWRIESELATARAETDINADQTTADINDDVGNDDAGLDGAADEAALYAAEIESDAIINEGGAIINEGGALGNEGDTTSNEGEALNSDSDAVLDDEFDFAAAFHNEMEQSAVPGPIEDIAPQAPLEAPPTRPSGSSTIGFITGVRDHSGAGYGPA